MRCYYHNDLDAIGTCKACGRGLCPDCAADLDGGLACKERCESDALAAIALARRNAAAAPQAGAIIRRLRRDRMLVSLFCLSGGIIFLAWGLTASGQFWFGAVISAVFLAYGAFILAGVLKSPGPGEPDQAARPADGNGRPATPARPHALRRTQDARTVSLSKGPRAVAPSREAASPAEPVFDIVGNTLRTPQNLDWADTSPFERALQELLETGHPSLVIDLSTVHYMSSAVAGYLAEAILSAKGKGCSVTIRASVRARRILDLAGLDQLADIEPAP